MLYEVITGEDQSRLPAAYKRVKRGDSPIEPLYSMEDVDATVPLLRAKRLGEAFEVVPGINVQLV